jgi:hypothetical protein
MSFDRNYMRVGRSGLRVLLLACLTGLISSACSAQVDAKVSLGGSACRQVTVPVAQWTPANRDADPAIGYQVREELAFRVPSSGSELYFAAVTAAGYVHALGPYSREKFAIGIHNSAPAREIKPEDWSVAKPLTRSDTQVLWEGIIGADDNRSATYLGKQFAKSGEHLALAIASANDRWLAVFSYDGKQGVSTPGSPGVPGRSKDPDHGVLYADVYNVATGSKVIALSGSFQNRTAPDWFLTSAFLEDRYFFFNTTDRAGFVMGVRQFLICELPPTPR